MQLVVRAAFVLGAIALINYVFPHHDAFRYEYELGMPWRYGRLTADFDFPVYHSDSVIQQMEDSLHRLVTPIYVQDSAKVSDNLQRLEGEQAVLGAEAYRHLRGILTGYYERGILSNPEKNKVQEEGFVQVRIASG